MKDFFGNFQLERQLPAPEVPKHHKASKAKPFKVIALPNPLQRSFTFMHGKDEPSRVGNYETLKQAKQGLRAHRQGWLGKYYSIWKILENGKEIFSIDSDIRNKV